MKLLPPNFTPHHCEDSSLCDVCLQLCCQALNDESESSGGESVVKPPYQLVHYVMVLA